MRSSDEALLANALEAYNQGNSKDAETALQNLLNRYPRRFEITETLGLIYAERGDLDRALPLLKSAYQSSPASAEAAANLGAAYLRLNLLPQALFALRRAVSLDPKNPATQSNYGQALLIAKRPGEAARAFAAADAGQPHNPDILYNWALAEFESGRAPESGKILTTIPPQLRSAQVESLCGDVEELEGHFDRALACFQTASKLEPSEANLNALCLELLKHWSFEEAIKIYEYATGRYPSSIRLQTGWGIALYGNAQYKDAARVFSRLLISVTNQTPYAKFLGESCVALRIESHEYCDVLLTYAQEHQADAVAGRLAAATIIEWHDSAQYNLSRHLLERAITRDPRSSDAYYRMGILDQEQERWSDSIMALKRAAALRPASSKTHLRLAQAYSHLGETDNAHREASLAKEFRQSEDIEMETKRKELKTFLLDTRSFPPNPN